MNRLLWGSGLVLLFLLNANSIVAQDKSESLTEIQQLKARVQQLEEQLFKVSVAEAQCRASLADMTARFESTTLSAKGASLQESRKALEGELRKALGAKEGDEVDWTTSPPSLKRSQEAATSK